MWLVIEDHDNLFIMAEFVHFAGIGMLLYKLFSKKNAGGESFTHYPCIHMLGSACCEHDLLLNQDHLQVSHSEHRSSQRCF